MEEQNAFKKSLGFLSKNQQKNGGFLSLSSPDKNNFSSAIKYRSIFSSSLISLCLANIQDKNYTKKTRENINNFLLSQKSKNWSFNYWTRRSKESKKMPYPDDLDDTFCALSAIWQYDPKIITGSTLAKIISILTATEQKEGGPYQTWLVTENAKNIWKDIDLAVNSNIAYFLSMQDIFLDNIISLTEKSITKNNFKSPYYPSQYPIIYFISRWYKGKKSTNIINAILSKMKTSGAFGENPLDTALSISSLLNFGFSASKLQKSINYILKNRLSDGGWDAFAFCIDPSIDSRKYYSGSRELTTAFCLEALAKFENAKQQISGKTFKCDAQDDLIYKKITFRAEKIFSNNNAELKTQLTNSFEKTMAGKDGFQIAALPYIFKKSLTNRLNKKITDDIIIDLGIINIYGWMAYTIYDDFFDGDGDPQLLPVANFCLRELTRLYLSLSTKYILPTEIFNKTMNKIDSANAWEMKNCRAIITDSKIIIPAEIPDYKKYSYLAERSLGHALGPITILLLLGYKINSGEIKNLHKFFMHYIIAKQLNDDAHDFEEDLKRGHISPPVALLMKKWKRKIINIDKDIEKIQKIFCNDILIQICNDIIKNITLANKALRNIKIIKNHKPFEDILAPINASALIAIDEQEKASQFLKSYKL